MGRYYSFPLFLFVFLLSCSPGYYRPLEVLPPPVPVCFTESFPTERSWTLVYRSGDGEIHRQEVGHFDNFPVSIDVLKESAVFCLLYPPCFDDHFSPHPAGGIFLPGDQGSLQLSWEDGAGAAFLLQATEGGLNPLTQNINRLMDEIREKGSPDPWLLDWVLLSRQLEQQEMRSWYIRKKHCFSVTVPFPVGQWTPASLWLFPIQQEDTGPREMELPEGDHYFCDFVRKKVFAVSVDEDGAVFEILYD